MPFKTIKLNILAKQLGVNESEIKEKQRIIDRIIKLRKQMGLSQLELAKRLGVSQSRIAQIESGIGTSKISFDVLLNIIGVLGFSYEVRLKKAA
jgi:transcriptional regulator with XRE-family HTH domain